MQRFLHRFVARDTVRKHVLSFGLFSAMFVMRISTPDKAGGLVRPRPPALHRLAGGQFGPDGKCLFCSLLWAHAKVELVEVRFHFGSGVGTFFELFWDFYVRRVKKWGHISGSVSGLAFRRFLVAGSEGRVFLSSEVFRDCFLVSLPGFSHVARTEKLRCPAHAAFRTIRWPVTKVCCTRSSMVPSLLHGSFCLCCKTPGHVQKWHMLCWV